jgi:hypothetical protein
MATVTPEVSLLRRLDLINHRYMKVSGYVNCNFNQWTVMAGQWVRGVPHLRAMLVSIDNTPGVPYRRSDVSYTAHMGKEIAVFAECVEAHFDQQGF